MNSSLASASARASSRPSCSRCVAKATPLALVLYLLAPLPVLIVALGWNHRAGLVGRADRRRSPIGARLSPLGGPRLRRRHRPAGLVARLSRAPRPPAADGAVEWYPLGRLLAWIAATAALTVRRHRDRRRRPAITRASTADARAIADAVRQAQLRGPPSAPKPARRRPRSRRVVAMRRALAPLSCGPRLHAHPDRLSLDRRPRSSRSPDACRGPGPTSRRRSMPRIGAGRCSPARSGSASLPAASSARSGCRSRGALCMAFALQGLAVSTTVTRGRAGRAAMLLSASTSCLVLSQGMLLVALALFGIADTAVRPAPPG